VDGVGNVLVVGQTSSGFPTANAFQASYHGAFVTKLSAPAQALRPSLWPLPRQEPW